MNNEYATNDYIDLLYTYSENENSLSKDDTAFCKTYNKAIEDGVIDDSEIDAIRGYVMDRHKARISKLQECDLEPVFNKIESS